MTKVGLSIKIAEKLETAGLPRIRADLTRMDMIDLVTLDAWVDQVIGILKAFKFLKNT